LCECLYECLCELATGGASVSLKSPAAYLLTTQCPLNLLLAHPLQALPILPRTTSHPQRRHMPPNPLQLPLQMRLNRPQRRRDGARRRQMRAIQPHLNLAQARPRPDTLLQINNPPVQPSNVVHHHAHARLGGGAPRILVGDPGLELGEDGAAGVQVVAEGFEGGFLRGAAATMGERWKQGELRA